MRNLCWLLIGLAALAFVVGTVIAFRSSVWSVSEKALMPS